MFETRQQQWLESAERMRANLRSHGALYARLVAAMGEDLKEVGVCHESNYILYQVTGDYECLLRVIRILRREGLSAAQPPAAGKPEYLEHFTVRDENKREVPGGPRALLHFASTVCKRVQIGTKLEYVPVYETVCGEPPTIDAAPAVAAMFNEPAP